MALAARKRKKESKRSIEKGKEMVASLFSMVVPNSTPNSSEISPNPYSANFRENKGTNRIM